MSMLVISPLPTLLSAWRSSAVVSPSFLLVCGSSPLATLLVLPASLSLYDHFRFELTLFAQKSTAFTSYGAFWLSFAALLIPGSGIGDAYTASTDPAQISDAIAIYLITWGVVTFLFLYVTLGKTASSCSNLFSLPPQYCHAPQVDRTQRALLLSHYYIRAPFHR